MKEYILSICIASVVCSILISLCGKSSYAPVIKMICGVFLAATLIAPVKQLRLQQLIDIVEVSKLDGASISQDGVQIAKNSVSDIISEQTQTYILDKATSMGANITVDVTVDQGSTPTPCSVEIVGSVSPYCKRRLQEIIELDLGISKENQTWR